MARVIRMQGYKDWKDGLITTEELLKGNIYREPQHVRDMWLRIIARATGNWKDVPHHPLCCCDKCAPTELDRKMKIEQHKSALEESQNVMADEEMPEIDHPHHELCCCEDCIDELFDKCYDSLAPSDCEPE